MLGILNSRISARIITATAIPLLCVVDLIGYKCILIDHCCCVIFAYSGLTLVSYYHYLPLLLLGIPPSQLHLILLFGISV